MDLAKEERVKKLNKEIKEFFHEKKKSKVRRNIKPGSSASLWKAVKKANDVDIKELPNTMYETKIHLRAIRSTNNSFDVCHGKVPKLVRGC